MSRTDKTKPWPVRVAEHHPYPEHDHRDGVCDLPESPYSRSTRWHTITQDCYWSDRWLTEKGNCCYGCGCRMCTDYYGRRAERRRSRHQAQRELRALLKDVTASE